VQLDNKDRFIRVPANGIRLLATTCTFCRYFTAYSPRPDVLEIVEKAHRCLPMREALQKQGAGEPLPSA